MDELLKKLKLIFFKKDSEEPAPAVTHEKKEVMSDLRCAKNELDMAISNFSFATDPELIDLYSYQIKAAQLKYNYHLTRAKKITP